MKNHKFSNSNILAYLDGTMHVDEKQKFIEALESDAELKNEVQLQKEIQDYLLDKEELNFIQTLENQRKDDLKHTKRFSLWYLALPVLALLVFFLFNNKEKTIQKSYIEKSENLIKKDEILKKETEVEKGQATQDQKAPIKDNLIPTVNDKEEKEENYAPKGQAASPQLAMANFSENEVFERLISNDVRGNEAEFKIITKTADQKFVDGEACKVKLLLEYNSKQTYIENNLQLYIFSNKKEAYKSFQPLITIDPDLSKTENGYKVMVDKKVKLNPGLYYYFLEKIDDEEILFIDKFLIK